MKIINVSSLIFNRITMKLSFSVDSMGWVYVDNLIFPTTPVLLCENLQLLCLKLRYYNL